MCRRGMHLIDNDVLMLISGGTIWNGNRIECASCGSQGCFEVIAMPPKTVTAIRCTNCGAVQPLRLDRPA